MIEKQDILDLVHKYWQSRIKLNKDEVPVSGAVFDASDIVSVVSTVLDGWFTESKVCDQFRHELCAVTKQRHAVLVNSGSSANLLAVTAIKDHLEIPDGKLVITSAVAFPTTVAPIIQNRLVPLFIDIILDNFGYTYEILKALFKRNDVAGAILTHTLGFPYAEYAISELAYNNGKFLISDCCDSLSATMDGIPVGNHSDMATYSFFPAHHITSGEGGAVLTNSSKLYRLLQQYSNWGRDCWCEPGQSNTCNKRFEQEFESLPKGYDHKYTFTKVGYNLKMTEMQGALGLSQIKKLSTFVEKRIQNYHYLRDKLFGMEEIDFVYPEYEFSPFGFPIRVVQEDSAKNLITHLEKNGIRTRPVFAGNITKHPMMKNVNYVIGEPLYNADEVMNKMFWVGVWPGLTDMDLDKIVDTIKEYYGGRHEI